MALFLLTSLADRTNCNSRFFSHWITLILPDRIIVHQANEIYFIVEEFRGVEYCHHYHACYVTRKGQYFYFLRFQIFVTIMHTLFTKALTQHWQMWHSRRKSTFRRKNTKISYLYHVVALTLLYLLVLVALQSVLLFPSYNGKQVDQ